MRQTKLTVHRQIFKENCSKVTKLLLNCKKDYYVSKIQELGNDCKQLYRITNSLMGNKNDSILLEHKDDGELATRFCDFFLGKIQRIRDDLRLLDASPMDDSLRADIQFVGVPLDVFDLVSVSEIRKIITKTPSKSCELDPIPTNLLQQCLDSVLPIITEIINRSF
jgi:hypothetical protein